jgi:exopolysaccharide biosynthesis predicted pyruvyltransferase EpsI
MKENANDKLKKWIDNLNDVPQMQMKTLNKNEKVLRNSNEEDIKIIQEYLKSNKNYISLVDIPQTKNKGDMLMTDQEKERLNEIKEQYLYFESHETVDMYEVYDADREDLVADLSFLIALVNKLIKE